MKNNTQESVSLFTRAQRVIPGGVNSPVRAFRSIGSGPRFIKKADGCYVEDEDGNRYIDYVLSWGPMLMGHNRKEILDAVMEAAADGLSFGACTKKEVEMAELVTQLVPSIDMVRMVNSGTEATMSAVRVARGYTGRDKIVKFAGCYHGHGDSFLVQAGSGVMTAGLSDSAGVTAGTASDTLVAEYNNLSSVEDLFIACGSEIAAIIVEPVAANMGVVLPEAGFLEGLREICHRYGSLLIFDEVITGFRLGITGAQGYYGVTPDLTTFGKIIGAGLPVGAYGGRREIMEVVAPLGPVYQAGTLSGNPVAMAAGYKALSILKEHPEYYTDLNARADVFFEKIKEMVDSKGYPCQVNHVGTLGSLFFTNQEVKNQKDAETADTEKFALYCNEMFENGIYIAPSQFEALFLSVSHREEILEQTLDTMSSVLSKVFSGV